MLNATQIDSDDPVLTTAAAARLLGVAVSTTQLWLESGALPSWKTPGGHRRVRLSAVTQLLAEKGRRQRDAAVVIAPPHPEFLPAPAQGYPLAPNERARLAAVRASGLVESEPEPVFDRLTWLATQVTDCPVALMTVLTSQRQWFKSRIGFPLPETPRAWAICSHSITHDGLFMVEDATRDVRFAANPLVTGEAQIRFYGGVPLRDAGGFALGTLCVIDSEPRRLRDREMKALVELAAIASDELQRRT
jgi:excisionase family DNA binding protein